MRTRHVGGAEEELRLVVGEEGGVAAAFLLGQRVDLALELAVRLDAARLAHHLAGGQGGGWVRGWRGCGAWLVGQLVRRRGAMGNGSQ